MVLFENTNGRVWLVVARGVVKAFDRAWELDRRSKLRCFLFVGYGKDWIGLLRNYCPSFSIFSYRSLNLTSTVEGFTSGTFFIRPVPHKPRLHILH